MSSKPRRRRLIWLQAAAGSTKWMPLNGHIVCLSLHRDHNIWLWNRKSFPMQVSRGLICSRWLSFSISMKVLDSPSLEGFQSYSGHPRISLLFLFSVSSQSIRGLKYSISGLALIFGWPVIMAIASGQGLLAPSFITSLEEDQPWKCVLDIITYTHRKQVILDWKQCKKEKKSTKYIVCLPFLA